jgi:hypothetical protein
MVQTNVTAIELVLTMALENTHRENIVPTDAALNSPASRSV